MKTQFKLLLTLVSFSLTATAVTGCSGDGGGAIPGVANGFSLSVLVTGSGTGAVTSFGAQPLPPSDGSQSVGTQIDCQSGQALNCTADYDSDAQVTLTATPGANSVFIGWTGACSGSALTCEVTVSQAQAVTAQFNIVQDGLQVAISGSGGGNVSSVSATIDCGNYSGAPTQCSAHVSQGTTVTLTAVAQAFSKFVGWSGGTCAGTTNICTLTVAQSQTVTATFNLIDPTAPLVSSMVLGGAAQGQVQALGLNYYIALVGVYPSSGGGSNTNGAPYLGQIKVFASGGTNSIPAGWVLCDGALLNISSNTALFSLLGTNYGGNGTSTFALPDLRARAALGAGSMTSPSSGPQSAAISASAPLISLIDLGEVSQGQVKAVGINYFIALTGVYPTSGGSNSTGGVFVGQLMLSGSNVTPAGWAPCNGALLNISSNTALFSLLGTNYGGNGTSNFALPDLRARAPMEAGTLPNPSFPPQTPGAPSVPFITTITNGERAQGQLGVLGMNFYTSAFGVYPSSGSSSGATGLYVSEIMLSAAGVTPSGWVPCNGTLLSISSNTTLFSLVGTTYGGNGQTTFAVPDLRARAVLGVGSN